MFPLKDNIPLARVPLVTITLVAINLLAYLLAVRHGGSFFGGPSENTAVRYGAIPYELTHPGRHCHLLTASGQSVVECTASAHIPGAQSRPATWLTPFTSMFLHGSFLHIFGNMLFLALFGPTLEDKMGRPRFVAFYLLGGLVALAALTAIHPDSTAPTIGASGAISAVLGGYILLFPRARILSLVFIPFFVTIVEVPAIVLLAIWFLGQLWFSLSGLADPLGGEGVAWFAQVGGFAFGLLAIRLFAPGTWARRGRLVLP